MDPKDEFSGGTIYFIFFCCIALFGLVYYQIFRETEFKPAAPVLQELAE